MGNETMKVDVGQFADRLVSCTSKVRLTVATSSFKSAKDVQYLLAADEAYRAASAELKQHEDDERYDDIYLNSLSRHTCAANRRAEALARVGGAG